MLVKKVSGLMLLVGVALGGSLAYGQDKPKPAEKPAEKAPEKKVENADPKSAAKPAAAAPDAAMEDAWQKAGAVTDNHKMLATLGGKWKSMNKFWMVPGTEPMTSECTVEGGMVMGGRFLQRTMKGNIMEQPFEGVEVMGYDNIKKKFVSSWMDNMGTGLYTSEGIQDPASKVITLLGTADDPVTGKPKKTRSTFKIDNPDQHTFAMFETPESGKEIKTLEIVYTRVK